MNKKKFLNSFIKNNLYHHCLADPLRAYSLSNFLYLQSWMIAIVTSDEN